MKFSGLAQRHGKKNATLGLQVYTPTYKSFSLNAQSCLQIHKPTCQRFSAESYMVLAKLSSRFSFILVILSLLYLKPIIFSTVNGEVDCVTRLACFEEIGLRIDQVFTW